MENKVKIGLIGLGTVGSGVYKTLQNIDNAEHPFSLRMPESFKILQSLKFSKKCFILEEESS